MLEGFVGGLVLFVGQLFDWMLDTTRCGVAHIVAEPDNQDQAPA